MRWLVTLGVVAFCVWVYTLIDCIRTNEFEVRGISKPAWVLTIILLPVIGSILWFTIGKGRGKGNRPAPRRSAPDDDADFLGRLSKEQEREERIRRLEEQLAELDDDNNTPKE